MKRIVKVLLVAIALAALAQPLCAWGSFGHMEVAYLAYQKLTPAMRARAYELLKLNPDFASWEETIPTGTSDTDKQMMIFMIASIWPDQIKSVAPYKDRFSEDNPANPNVPPNSPTAGQNVGYSDLFRHRYWHFIDEPFSQHGSRLPAVPSPNVKTQIAAFRATLSSTSPDSLKSYDLVWLLHLIGDVHQPLHCATRVTSDHPDGDQGGNLVKCTGCTPGYGQLHGFWDDLPGTTGNKPDYQKVIATASALGAPKASLAHNLNADTWIAEGLKLAKTKVYSGPIRTGGATPTLTEKYKNTSQALANERVALAGARLGNLINEELK